jgi:aminoglycoside phosphotransferase (APT) family kinase protein
VAARAAAAPAIAALVGASYPRCVTHGDVIDGNVVLVDGELVLIDWAKAAWTSPARDAVRWAMAVEAYGSAPAPAALAAYAVRAGRPPDLALRATLASATGYLLLQLGQAGGDDPLRRHLKSRLAPAVRWFASEFGLPPPPGSS